ncbi:MAG: argininosuccinate lyase [Thermodesulfobacteriota bacterium]
MAGKLWGGRFTEATDNLVEAFTSSIEVDCRLYAHDIAGSIAHAKTLEKAGVLTREECEAIVAGLGMVKDEIAAGEMEFSDSLEDIHMHVESRLSELIGDTARKLHTGRSRNDQVATDVRLYLRDETKVVLELLRRLSEALVMQAESNLGVVLPGYTHMQRAQPVLLSHHLMAYFEMFSRDHERFSDALFRINVMPLGSAALAGSTFPLDREYTAKLLGFSGASKNSMDAVSDRDFALEFISAATIAMVHLSRMSEELVLWAGSEFGFVHMPDSFSTGSSIMPQKKNPDVAELTRGKTGRVLGDFVALSTLMKALPLAYNRDMQEDKPPLFDAVDTLKQSLAVFAAMLPKLGFNARRMGEAASSGYLNATDLADYLAAKGVPFREAHHRVGQTVAYAIREKKELDELSLDELNRFCEEAGPDIHEFLQTLAVVNRRKTKGGTAEENVKKAITEAKKSLGLEG